ncbi:hypothetical protein BDV32DRAFT_149533 [Aspergillus pseudonomiae]|uniref:Uncharacterized protein n=1 Tax=Aspergillus pseudonomiae TaxID=1506151 RepID=A0A5N7D8P5_9EURO|nr:uncharacterized protein BDV37DRAFT_284824 [Aspergillus pseudonomiae]KAB8260307.1 hypothetical protein BDV32DRAFT_149533 [Aspergillus pseudonomiae]KAE8402343.1 hypothetical protein BDV37DRAFT_284824 [Aspergillus pseudonomiae]
MRFQSTRSLASLVTVTAAAASDVASFLYPEGLFSGDAKLIGTTGGPLTTLAFNCPETATPTATTGAATRSTAGFDDEDDDQCWVPDGGYTITAGSTTFEFAYTTPGFTISAGCSFDSTTYASCKATSTFVSDTGVQNFETSSSIPYITVAITATESSSTSAAASDTRSVASKTTASDTGSSTVGPSSPPTSTAVTSDNAGIPLATGAAQCVAGGAVMMLALAMA